MEADRVAIVVLVRIERRERHADARDGDTGVTGDLDRDRLAAGGAEVVVTAVGGAHDMRAHADEAHAELIAIWPSLDVRQSDRCEGLAAIELIGERHGPSLVPPLHRETPVSRTSVSPLTAVPRSAENVHVRRRSSGSSMVVVAVPATSVWIRRGRSRRGTCSCRQPARRYRPSRIPMRRGRRSTGTWRRDRRSTVPPASGTGATVTLSAELGLPRQPTAGSATGTVTGVRRRATARS